MSKLIMFDWGCDNGHEFEELVKPDTLEMECPQCGAIAKRLISPVRSDWRKMGVDPDFPTAASKWEKMQRQKASKEDSVNLKHY